MARKITHTKRGTYYNGPTGRHKVSDPLGSLLFSAAKTISKSSKSSKKSLQLVTILIAVTVAVLMRALPVQDA